jgi:DNA-binding NarL/FixJ family response regulator
MIDSSLVKIVVVDDNPLIRDGIRAIFSTHHNWMICGEAESESDAIQLIRDTKPHLVIVELLLREGDGLNLLKRIATITNPPKTLVCSIHEESLYIWRAIHAGARGYVNKQQASETLITAVECILEGNQFLSECLENSLMDRVFQNVTALAPSPIDRFTDRELQVFEAIGRGMNIHQIAESLHLGNKTIETYRERAKKKLNLRDAHELTHMAIKWNSERASLAPPRAGQENGDLS